MIQNEVKRGMGHLNRREFSKKVFFSALTASAACGVQNPSGKMLSFETRGEPFQRGKLQGEVCGKLFLPWSEGFLRQRAQRHGFASTSGFLDAIRRDTRIWRDQMEELDPSGFEECRGIAEGVGLDLDAYFAVHFFEFPGIEGSDVSSVANNCTVVGKRDSLGHVVVGKTDDVAEHELGMNVLETTWPDEGYPHLHFHFAGTIWTVAGMNSRGLAMGMTGIPSPRSEEPGVTSLTALHKILPNCATVKESIEFVRKLKLNAGGFSLILGDADGEMVVVERTVAGMVIFNEESGPLIHANEILDEEFAAQNPSTEDPTKLNSQDRCANANRLLLEGKKVEEIMLDQSPTGAIFQTGQNDMYTDFASVFYPQQKAFKFWEQVHPSWEVKNLDVIF